MSELLEKVLKVYSSHPRTAILISGSGSNARAILANEEVRGGYDIRTIVTDNENSNAQAIAQEFDLGLVQMHQGRFASFKEREIYFEDMSQKLGKIGINAVFYAGFMKIVPPSFTRNFPGVNIHPADLTITDKDDLPVYRGIDAMSAMRKDTGDKVASSVHVVDGAVDAGSVIAVSDEVVCSKDSTDEECHLLLKKREHVVYPKTLIKLAQGVVKARDLPLHEEDL